MPRKTRSTGVDPLFPFGTDKVQKQRQDLDEWLYSLKQQGLNQKFEHFQLFLSSMCNEKMGNKFFAEGTEIFRIAA